jgi:hypothetical protein
MIKKLRSGEYQLLETKQNTKMLVLDGKSAFAWVVAGEIGEILVSAEIPSDVGAVLSAGEYRLYLVKDEPKLVDLEHLELAIGDGHWQGYLLPTGLPSSEDKRNRIIATDEVITKA